MALLLSATLLSYTPAGSPPLTRARRASSVIAMAGQSLEQWLQAEAGVAPKFLPTVLSICEDEVSAQRDDGAALARTAAAGTSWLRVACPRRCCSPSLTPCACLAFVLLACMLSLPLLLR